MKGLVVYVLTKSAIVQLQRARRFLALSDLCNFQQEILAMVRIAERLKSTSRSVLIFLPRSYNNLLIVARIQIQTHWIGSVELIATTLAVTA